jgi:hypothetical protein
MARMDNMHCWDGNWEESIDTERGCCAEQAVLSIGGGWRGILQRGNYSSNPNRRHLTFVVCLLLYEFAQKSERAH